MWFYGRMKGMSGEDVRKETDTLLEDVGLLHKRHEQTKNLSGNSLLFTGLPHAPFLPKTHIYIYIYYIHSVIFLPLQ